MKQCPTCNRTYSDESLAFCLEDGTVLNQLPDAAPTQYIPTPRVTTPANFTGSAPSKPFNKLWLAIPIVLVLGFLAICGVVLLLVFANPMFGDDGPRTGPGLTTTPRTTPSPFSTPLSTPTPTAITSSQLVGSWRTEVVENKIPLTIIAVLNADGTYSSTFKNKQGQVFKDRGTWQFSDNTLFQTFSNGASGKGSVRMVDADTFELTIVDNGVPAYNGLKRMYHRIS